MILSSHLKDHQLYKALYLRWLLCNIKLNQFTHWSFKYEICFVVIFVTWISVSVMKKLNKFRFNTPNITNKISALYNLISIEENLVVVVKFYFYNNGYSRFSSHFRSKTSMLWQSQNFLQSKSTELVK